MKKESNSALGLKWELETTGGAFLKLARSEGRMRLVSKQAGIRHNPWVNYRNPQ